MSLIGTPVIQTFTYLNPKIMIFIYIWLGTKWKVICLIVLFHLSEPLGPSVFEFLLYCEQRGPGSKYTLPLKGIGGSRRSETTLQDADSQKGV